MMVRKPPGAEVGVIPGEIAGAIWPAIKIAPSITAAIWPAMKITGAITGVIWPAMKIASTIVGAIVIAGQIAGIIAGAIFNAGQIMPAIKPEITTNFSTGGFPNDGHHHIIYIITHPIVKI